MKNFKLVSALIMALAMFATVAPLALAEADQGDSITVTLDRRVRPESYFHPGRFFLWGDRVATTVTVYEPVIRNYNGDPIESFTIQTASGRTNVPIDTVQEICLNNRIGRRTDDIPDIERTVKANILFTNGTEKQVLMSADFGTIEGKTDRGELFVADPSTVRYIMFHRSSEEG
jgi:hypothetical protein